MATIVSMGSLYFNGQAQVVGVSYNGETISFEDTVPVCIYEDLKICIEEILL